MWNIYRVKKIKKNAANPCNIRTSESNERKSREYKYIKLKITHKYYDKIITFSKTISSPSLLAYINYSIQSVLKNV